MESDACSRKRQPSEDSSESNRPSRSRDRHASKLVGTLESRVQRNNLPLVNQDFVTPLSGIVPPPKQRNLSTIHLAPSDQQKDFPLASQGDDIALRN